MYWINLSFLKLFGWKARLYPYSNVAFCSIWMLWSYLLQWLWGPHLNTQQCWVWFHAMMIYNVDLVHRFTTFPRAMFLTWFWAAEYHFHSYGFTVFGRGTKEWYHFAFLDLKWSIWSGRWTNCSTYDYLFRPTKVYRWQQGCLNTEWNA